jgi:hypothetical protein
MLDARLGEPGAVLEAMAKRRTLLSFPNVVPIHQVLLLLVTWCALTRRNDPRSSQQGNTVIVLDATVENNTC